MTVAVGPAQALACAQLNPEKIVMDLGIRGKKAIVCASSKGLGRGCAMALAEAGVDLVVNGRNAELVASTAKQIRDRFGVKVIEIVGDVSKPEVQKALLAA